MSETEPTDPLAELRAIAEADGLTATTILDASRAGRLILRAVTSPEAPGDIAAELWLRQTGKRWDFCPTYLKVANLNLANGILRFIAEKAVTR